MAHFNKAENRAKPQSIDTAGHTPTTTHEGGEGFNRSAKGELFLTSLFSFNEDSFYESSSDRNERIMALAGEVAQGDPEWILGLVKWLREEVGMRTSPTIVAVGAVNARLANGHDGFNRQIVRASIGRLDEVANFASAWSALTGKRKLPTAVKRGLADAIVEKMHESSLLKWNRTKGVAYTLSDMIQLTHPKPKDARQEAVFKAALDMQYGNEPDTSKLPILRARKEFLALDKDTQIKLLSDPETAHQTIKDARLTHEVIAGAIGVIPSDVWKHLIDHMSIVALRMNLRRISESNPENSVYDRINEKLANDDDIRSSRTLPISLYTAYNNTHVAFGWALEKALETSLQNIPKFSGKTAILLDSSGSMECNMSMRSNATYYEVAKVFATGIYMRSDKADLYLFDTRVSKHELDSRLGTLKNISNIPFLSGGTDIKRAVDYAMSNGKYDRVIVITDEQSGSYLWHYHYKSSNGDVYQSVPSSVPLYVWNIAGYSPASSDQKPGRYFFGGVSDSAFKMIDLLENKTDADKWPWEQ